ncbi:MAG TPA: hypothetical protein VJ727_12105 [Rhodanobacteraceae bacterium]|nr:hypothetical protein [Rhodanobacteraceae bacterium]
MSIKTRSIFSLSLASALLLGACASHPQHETAPSPSSTAASEQHRPAPVIPRHAAKPAAPSETTPAPPGEMVGVASCDQYLSTYKACHRAAGIYPPDQIDARYEAMRDGLLRDARDPAKRATLDNRCRALSKLLTDALHGKSCNAAPVASSTGGS